MLTPLALALSLLSAAPDHHEPDHHENGEAQDGFVPIWDGETFDGWRSNNDDSFQIEDGAIVVNGDVGHLFHERELTDFEFRCEIKTTPGSNSGVFICTKYQERGWPAQGYEVQVNVSHRDPVKSGSLYNTVKRFDAGVKDGEWYTQAIRVRGNKVTVSINGEVLYEFDEPPGVTIDRRLQKGVLALQAHDPGSTVYFRNLTLKDLSGE